MARRPKRSYADELAEHARIAHGALSVVDALVRLEPDVAEFFAVRKLLADGLKEVERKRDAVRAAVASPADQSPDV